MRLTPHFTLEEFLVSQEAVRHGINNSLPKHLWNNLLATAEGLERCRAWLNKPITITSGFRCQELNQKIGGENNSQHCLAQAADIICPSYGTAYSVAKQLADNRQHIKFDQLIYEYRSWVHISFSTEPRDMVLSMHSKKEGYLLGVVY